MTHLALFSYPPEQVDHWFTGFWEGDGSLVTRRKHEKSPEIILNLYQKDKSILEKIQHYYKRGKIYQRKGSVPMYSVSKQEDIAFFLGVLEGKIHTKKRLHTYTKTVQDFSALFYPLPFVQDMPCVSLESAWLSGFTDAEGCFYMKPCKKRYVVRFEFSLSQKNERVLLNKIMHFLEVGTIHMHKPTQAEKLQVVGAKHMKILGRYFEKYPLQSLKKEEYVFWKKAVDFCLEKKHLSSNGHAYLLALTEKLRKRRQKKLKQRTSPLEREKHS